MTTENGWFKSSYSGPHNNNCVEARFAVQGIDIRDSKDQHGPILSFTRAAWTKFTNATRNHFDADA